MCMIDEVRVRERLGGIALKAYYPLDPEYGMPSFSAVKLLKFQNPLVRFDKAKTFNS